MADKAKSPLIVIPVYNHAATLRGVLDDLRSHGHQDLLVIDDGSQDAIAEVMRSYPDLPFLRHSENQGKGAAIATGMRYAQSKGFEAILTFDADGQHRAIDVATLLQEHAANPDALIIGARDFDSPESGAVPGSSRFGRSFSNFWIYAESGRWLDDTQTGLRIYPIDLELLDSVKGRRYAFEVEIITRTVWQGRPTICVPVSVFYPERGKRVSHFDALHDNVRLSKTHTWLCTLHVLKLLGLYRPLKLRKKQEVKGMDFTRNVIKYFGVRAAYAMIVFPVLTTFLTRKAERLALVDFYRTLHPGWSSLKINAAVFKNYLMFAASIIDRTQAKGSSLVDSPSLKDINASLPKLLPAGAILMGAHYGDWALIAHRIRGQLQKTLGLVIDASVTPRFFRELEGKLGGRLRILNPKADKLGFALEVKEILDEGGQVAFLPDRVSGPHPSIACEFLGREASFLRAPFALAVRLRAPVVFLCAHKIGLSPSGRYDLHIQEIWNGIDRISEDELLRRYVRALEIKVSGAPQHWFNFFPFWQQVPS